MSQTDNSHSVMLTAPRKSYTELLSGAAKVKKRSLLPSDGGINVSAVPHALYCEQKELTINSINYFTKYKI